MKRGDILELTIDNYAFGGKGIAKVIEQDQPFAVFVEGGIPGQKVKVRVAKKRKRHAECKLIEVLERSPLEIELPYQPVSGAPYISLPIEKQREFKQESTLEQYRRLGGFQNIQELFDVYIASPLDYNYRNKMEFSFSCIRQNLETEQEEDDAFALGSKTKGTWWKVEDLDKNDGIFDAQFEEKLKEIREYLKATQLPAWHPPQKVGFYRHLVVRKSFDTNHLLINLVTSSQGIEDFERDKFTQFMVNLLGERLAGLQHTINDDVADRSKIENGLNQLLYGVPVIEEKLLGLSFEISMESFFQTNPKSAELLYQKAIDYANEGQSLNGKTIMDLFCGTGTIGQIIASNLSESQVVGVDIVAEAIEDAKRNATKNNLSNLSFYAADVGKFLLEYPQYQGNIHTIMLDPPRAGIAPKTLQRVIDLKANRIVYISCNPATQARDAKTLQEAGYQLKKISLVDQFPHTSHIEAVALFDLE